MSLKLEFCSKVIHSEYVNAKTDSQKYFSFGVGTGQLQRYTEEVLA